MTTTAREADPATTAARTEALFDEAQRKVWRRTDRLFAWLMGAQWIAGIGVALVVSPRTWLGAESSVHLHVWAAILLGGAITGLPVYLALTRSGWGGTRHVIAAAQMLWAGLLIHLTGGRLESHFHIFGSLALIAFYRDWRVLLTATVVTAADHFIRGVAWPQSLYGVAAESTWRWTEHAFWVVFENAFLTMASLQGVQEMRNIAARQAELEAVNHAVDLQVQARTRELSERGAELARSNQELDSIVRKLQAMQEELLRSGKTVAVAAEEHQRSTVRQSTAVEQTRQTMQSLASASSRIASLAQEVAGHAAQSRSASQALGDRTRELIDASSRMGTLLESVKEIATKSELLALNAALEGARSGDAGRGFSLVAAQMQRLAESVAASVRDIQALLDEVRRAGQAGAVAIEQSSTTAEATAERAEQIRLTTQQQQAGVDQIHAAMGDLAASVAETVQTSTAIAASAAELRTMALDAEPGTNGRAARAA